MPTSVPWGIVPVLGAPPAGLPSPPPVRAVEGSEPRIWQGAHAWTRLMGEAAVRRSDVWQAARRPVSEAPLMGAGFVRVPEGLEAPWPVEDGFLFGFCVFTAPGPPARPAFLEPLRVGEVLFPLLILPAEYVPRMPMGWPADPTDSLGVAQGTAACWARAKLGGLNPLGLTSDGILTAAHVAMTISSVPGMSPGAAYAVSGFAIDAAVMCPDHAPPGARALTVGPSVVGASVNVHTQLGGFTPATVLLDFQPTAYFGKNCPHRAIIDRAFVGGDSGSLARDSRTGEGIGIYIGDVHPPGVKAQGACQLLEQVTAELDIDLYL